VRPGHSVRKEKKGGLLKDFFTGERGGGGKPVRISQEPKTRLDLAGGNEGSGDRTALEWAREK